MARCLPAPPRPRARCGHLNIPGKDQGRTPDAPAGAGPEDAGMRMTHVSAAAAALSLGLAACGGGSDGLSKGDLSKKANAICSAAQKKADGVKQPTNIQDAGD